MPIDLPPSRGNMQGDVVGMDAGGPGGPMGPGPGGPGGMPMPMDTGGGGMAPPLGGGPPPPLGGPPPPMGGGLPMAGGAMAGQMFEQQEVIRQALASDIRRRLQVAMDMFPETAGAMGGAPAGPMEPPGQFSGLDPVMGP